MALSLAAHADAGPTRATAIQHAASALAHGASLGLTSAENTSVRDVIVDKDGTQHVRYDRTYHGLPVLGGDFVVHLAPDGAYRSADRATRSEMSLASILPKVSATKAADLAVNALHGTPKLAWRTDAVGLDSLGNPVARTVVTSKTAALTYSGESGFGHTALRYMDKPSKDGNSADYWSSSVGNLDVHYSSGVANHFAHLLAEGSGPKTINGVSYDSPTYNGSTLTGIGRDKVGRIWYRALTVYMTSSTNYAGARTATLNAAKDLYGAGSTEYNAVAAAWSAVNVN